MVTGKQDNVEGVKLLLANTNKGTYDSWDITKDSQQNVDQEVGSTTALGLDSDIMDKLPRGRHLYVNIAMQGHTERGEDNGKDDLADVSGAVVSADSPELTIPWDRGEQGDLRCSERHFVKILFEETALYGQIKRGCD
jgi:hypothetical protein